MAEGHHGTPHTPARPDYHLKGLPGWNGIHIHELTTGRDLLDAAVESTGNRNWRMTCMGRPVEPDHHLLLRCPLTSTIWMSPVV